MSAWMVLGIVALLLVGAAAYVGWRDRDRLPSRDDDLAARDARAAQQRHEIQRHQSQADTWQAGRNEGGF
ncbi:hypothetical protein ACIBTV_21185 [Micromonospora sp. NPDC049366]|uniref:hypothetical protein n=1 Tax=Micromonospora sp. NPDC049366 TaxID=3364271 RepID=UPI0037AB5574